MSWFFTNLISAFLLPPLNMLLVGLVGLFVVRARPRLGRALIFGSLTLLWLCATPYVTDGALRLLEEPLRSVGPKNHPADAIVVLGGGTYFSAPEYGGIDTVNAPTLMRLRYAAKLQRETGKPILVSGGKPVGEVIPQAQQMKSVLEKEFNVPVRWTEDASDNTFENAHFSYQILQKAGIKRIYLVTDAWHMLRSLMVFEAAGFEVTPVLQFSASHSQNYLFSFIPNIESINNSSIFMHELIGLLWYRLKS